MLGFEMRQIHQDPCVELLQDKINFGVLEAIKTIPAHPLSSTVQVLESLWVRLLLPVLQHLVSSNICRIPTYEQLFQPQSVCHVVIFPAPTPEQVGEAIDSPELVHSHGRDAAEDVVIRKSVEEGIDADGHVTWLDRTRVQVPIIFWKQIHVMEDVALVVHVLFDSFRSTNIHQHCAVEGLITSLFHNVDPILDLLFL